MGPPGRGVMSAEHFQTILSADVRSSADGRTTEWAPAGTGSPRLTDIWADGGESRHRAWFTTSPYAEDVVRIAARAVREQPMDGITGDHPEKREQAALILDASADLVRRLALDSAYDSRLTDQRWAEMLANVRREAGDA